ncbi:5'/3'-nucleotidase SurE [Commensalibacter papalotli (ex Botero et al. 2024)]|uniref:5'/3'-nucleotidase SurE n=1 Tax=Commensalibacter papalotli (ex Botero et al. 2024) TaxID=2972766 RepID=UPI0022FFB1E2|nr:5'/3'-nucleotidase SurE [Commensalibacter papalotli (ex Botero et al. 2024)]CAI3928855.1 Broad specificity polyphosphatase and 5'/3'-nucleotidase SurE (SurE) (PDB:2V4N) [Commensalibacter papalotli (ex Botero et al. 2024)]
MTYLYDRVLLTNDDGIEAPGIKILENIASKIAKEVWVVAPEQDQSGTSQSISIHNPLRAFEKSDKHYAVTGTPGDCVVMGLRQIMPQLPDVILSGVNRGCNLGIETLFSGTVGAAMTGCLLNIPSIAFSQSFRDGHDIYWETAYHYGPKVMEKLSTLSWQHPRTCLNINFPDCPYDEVKSIEFTTQGIGYIDDISIVKKTDMRKTPYYWLNFDRPIKEDIELTETQVVNNKSISITPLSFDRTNNDLLQKMKS